MSTSLAASTTTDDIMAHWHHSGEPWSLDGLDQAHKRIPPKPNADLSDFVMSLSKVYFPDIQKHHTKYNLQL